MPVYVYNDIECVSAGVVFYSPRDEQVEMLFLEKTDKKNQLVLEDPGGKSQSNDISIDMTAAREAAEELNAQIQDPDIDVSQMNYQQRVNASRAYILKLINLDPLCLLHPSTGYALFFVRLDTRHIDFGTHEIHPKYDIKRQALWLTSEQLLDKSIQVIHPRIRHILKYL